MALNLPDAPASLDVDVELTAALEPGTGTDLEDPDRPVRGLLRRRHGQVEQLLDLAVAIAAAAVALESSTGQLRTDVDAIDTTGGGPTPDLSGYATLVQLDERYVRPASGIPLSDLTAAGVAALRQRSTHTGVQPVASVENLQAILDVLRVDVDGLASGDGPDLSGYATLAALAERYQLPVGGIPLADLATATLTALRDRAGHTGVQPVSTVEGLQLALDGKAPGAHGHTAAQITDATTVGRALLLIADGPSARATLGAAAATHTHAAADVSDSTAVGRSLLKAADAAAARTAISAGTSSLALGSTSSTAAAGNHGHVASAITDATTTGRAVLTAASGAAAILALGAVKGGGGIDEVLKKTQAEYDAIVTKSATTLYVIEG